MAKVATASYEGKYQSLKEQWKERQSRCLEIKVARLFQLKTVYSNDMIFEYSDANVSVNTPFFVGVIAATCMPNPV